METIFWITVSLFLIALVSVVIIIYKHRKMFSNDAEVPYDDMPARYDDVQYRERPYIEMI